VTGKARESAGIPEKSVPLILFLHGADVTGRDNELQIRAHDIGSVLAREKWQAIQPSVILAPQYDLGYHWSRPATMGVLFDLMESLSIEFPITDPERALVYGYSAGGIGALKMIKRRPGYFKKAIIMCAATGNEMLQELTSTPMWLFHAADDGVVSNRKLRLYTSESYLGSVGIYELLKDTMADDIRYTEYAPGELMEKYGVDPHCAWVPVSRDEAALKWFIEK
jgi:predicted peptidase